MVVVISSLALIFLGCLIGFLTSNQISRPLIRTIRGISKGSERLTEASSQISSASAQLAEGASEQAASLEESSATMEEIASLAKQNEESLAHLSELSQKTVDGMNASHESLIKTMDTMSLISASGEQMAKINKSIGFAVVANEVRNLALRASDAAKNTQELIYSTLEQISNGNGLVNRTVEQFQLMQTDGKKVMELVVEINRALHEQTTGIEQVNQSLQEMDGIVQRNAASAEQSASATRELNAEAEEMRDHVVSLEKLAGHNHNGTANGEGTYLPDETQSFARLSAPAEAPAIRRPFLIEDKAEVEDTAEGTEDF
jgi:methyl-accepting chemotaxis protein